MRLWTSDNAAILEHNAFYKLSNDSYYYYNSPGLELKGVGERQLPLVSSCTILEISFRNIIYSYPPLLELGGTRAGSWKLKPWRYLLSPPQTGSRKTYHTVGQIFHQAPATTSKPSKLAGGRRQIWVYSLPNSPLPFSLLRWITF